MEFQIRIVRGGILMAQTFIEAEDRDDLLVQLIQVVQDEQAGDTDWTEGVDE